MNGKNRCRTLPAFCSSTFCHIWHTILLNGVSLGCESLEAMKTALRRTRHSAAPTSPARRRPDSGGARRARPRPARHSAPLELSSGLADGRSRRSLLRRPTRNAAGRLSGERVHPSRTVSDLPLFPCFFSLSFVLFAFSWGLPVVKSHLMREQTSLDSSRKLRVRD